VGVDGLLRLRRADFAGVSATREILAVPGGDTRVAMVLVAYREMDWFSALQRNFGLELRWVQWDRTLLAYALFPYFPSDPPRVAFSGSDMPHVSTVLRELNLWLVRDYGIHSSVFPSAHVSSAFSAAWALLAHLPERRRIGRGMLVYALSVALATVYGRYHYAADVVAGMAVSLIPATMILLARRRLRVRGLLGLP
jgi:membrane-associated phospholipid phosphatase